MRFGIAREGRAVELCFERVVGKAGQPVSPRQGLIRVGPRPRLRLTAELDRLHLPARVVEPQPPQAVEEHEVDTPPREGLVERREDDVAHARAHLPEQRALVVEEEAACQLQAGTRFEGGPRVVAVAVAEHQVVHAAHETGVDRLGLGAVANQPLPEIEVVDRAEAAGGVEQAVGVDAEDGRRDEVDDLPETPRSRVGPQASAELVPGLTDRLDHRPDHRQARSRTDPRQRIARLRGGDQRGDLRPTNQVVQVAQPVSR